MNSTILVIEDDVNIMQFLRETLIEKGYSVRTATSGAEGIKVTKKIMPNLVLLDLGLPDMSGETVCVEVKKISKEIGVVILTAREGNSNVVRNLELGADDYVMKPFDGDVLLARIKANIRAREGEEKKLTVGDLEMDKKTMEVYRSGKKIQLTAQEFKLLEYLMSNSGKVLTRDMILNRIWLSSPDIETRVVDVYIGYLRKKIDAGHKKKLLHSIRGFGYVLKQQ